MTSGEDPDKILEKPQSHFTLSGSTRPRLDPPTSPDTDRNL